MFHIARRAFLATLLAAAGLATAAPPKLETLFPAGAKRGCEAEVTADGSFSSWPVRAWVDRPGLQIQPGKQKGNLRISVDPDASCGVYYLRLYSDEGCSSLRPFLVGTLAEIAEQEPNDEIKQAQHLSASVTVNGRLKKSGDVDGFAIKLEAGQQLVASLQANTSLGSPMDGVLQICSQRGFVLQQNDDARGLDPLLSFAAPRAGTYIVRTFAFPSTPNGTIGFAGSSAYVYRLTLTTGGYLDHSLPLAIPRGESTELKLFGWNIGPDVKPLLIVGQANRDWVEVFHPQLASTLLLPQVVMPCLVADKSSSPGQPQPVELPINVSGRIESGRDEDVFEFTGRQGQKVICRAESDALGYLLDPLLILSDSSGKELSRVDDTKRARDSVLRATLPAEAKYRISIRDVHGQGGLRYAYRLTVREEQPDFTLTVAADSFVLTPSTPLEIPVAIGRLEGFASELRIEATSLPEGVTAEAVKSAVKGDSSKSVKLVLKAGSGTSAGTIQIHGTEIGGREIRRNATYSLSATPRRGKDVWLTVLKSERGCGVPAAVRQ